ncbi:MAG: hypothetical protein EP329_09315 [Deltaproteobacteria bacterium]|nr:MAG: hypothetical protein EP329_09315 [Deltaproteobacteria bacterium]
MTRSHRLVRLAVLALVTTALSPGAAAIDPPHDATNLPQGCDSCHTTHASFGTLLDPSVGTSVENLCASCHYAGGPGRDASVHACTGATCDATFSVSCTVCHDPHKQRQNLENGSTYGMLLRTTITTPSSGARAVVFTGNTGPHSFADGDAVIDGVCEVCHTQTTYHTNDGAHPASHLFASLARCTNCHTHVDGFRPGGDCTTCHSDRSSGSAMRLSGPHRRHVVSEGYDCTTCHGCVVDAQGQIVDGALHANLQATVCGSFTWNASTRTCSNIGCHGTDTWTNRALTGCTLCHGDATDRRLPNRHQTHLADGIGCAECHAPVVTSNSAIADLGLHMNGSVTVVPGYNWNPVARTCSNFTCHGETHQTESW